MKVNFGILVAGTALLVGTQAFASFASIAYSRATKEFSISYRWADKVSSERDAMSRCTADDCKVVGTVQNACIALANSTQSLYFGWGWDRTGLPVAERKAIKYCEVNNDNCTIVTSACSE